MVDIDDFPADLDDIYETHDDVVRIAARDLQDRSVDLDDEDTATLFLTYMADFIEKYSRTPHSPEEWRAWRAKRDAERAANIERMRRDRMH